MYALVWDDSAPEDATYEKLSRAIYTTLEEAIAQGEYDCERGKRVLCIEEIDSVERDHLNRGEVVWEP